MPGREIWREARTCWLGLPSRRVRCPVATNSRSGLVSGAAPFLLPRLRTDDLPDAGERGCGVAAGGADGAQLRDQRGEGFPGVVGQCLGRVLPRCVEGRELDVVL